MLQHVTFLLFVFIVVVLILILLFAFTNFHPGLFQLGLISRTLGSELIKEDKKIFLLFFTIALGRLLTG